MAAKGKQKVKKLELTVRCLNEACEAELGGEAVAKKKGEKRKRASVAKKNGKKTFEVEQTTLSVPAGGEETERVKFTKNKQSVRKLRGLLKRKAYRRGTKARKFTRRALEARLRTRD